MSMSRENVYTLQGGDVVVVKKCAVCGCYLGKLESHYGGVSLELCDKDICGKITEQSNIVEEQLFRIELRLNSIEEQLIKGE